MIIICRGSGLAGWRLQQATQQEGGSHPLTSGVQGVVGEERQVPRWQHGAVERRGEQGPLAPADTGHVDSTRRRQRGGRRPTPSATTLA